MVLEVNSTSETTALFRATILWRRICRLFRLLLKMYLGFIRFTLVESSCQM
jgi:hypothetical protein